MPTELTDHTDQAADKLLSGEKKPGLRPLPAKPEGHNDGDVFRQKLNDTKPIPESATPAKPALQPPVDPIDTGISHVADALSTGNDNNGCGIPAENLPTDDPSHNTESDIDSLLALGSFIENNSKSQPEGDQYHSEGTEGDLGGVANRVPELPWSGAKYVGEVNPDHACVYDRIRGNSGDTARIAEITGISQSKLDQIKAHLFYREHEIPIGPGRIQKGNFAPDSRIADLWPKADSGQLTPEEAQYFHRLMAHEYVESSLMNNGMPYRSSDPCAWDPVRGNHPTPQYYGAHDLAPRIDPIFDPFGHWESSLGRSHPCVREIAPDLSNLDGIIRHILSGGT